LSTSVENDLEVKVTLELDKTEIFLLTGATAEITASVTGSGVVEWESSFPSVAMMNNTGTVKAISPGTTVITAAIGSKEASCIVTVIQPGNSIITGTIDNTGTGIARVNLYIKSGKTGETKKGIIGGYVLLATTVPNNDKYKFDNLPEGVYQVDVEMDDYESEASQVINLSEGEIRTNVDFIVDAETGTVVPKVVTGTVETWRAASLQIYPNPFTDVVRISGVVETLRATSLQIQVINAAGTIVHTQTIASPDETIRLGHLPTGMYFIRIENGKAIKAIKIQ
jgi:hypothetical protein